MRLRAPPMLTRLLGPAKHKLRAVVAYAVTHRPPPGFLALGDATARAGPPSDACPRRANCEGRPAWAR